MKIEIKPPNTFTLANGSKSSILQTAQIQSPDKRQISIERQFLQSRVMNISRLAELIFWSLAKQRGLSYIRMGDSELLILAQELLFPTSIPISHWISLLSDLCCDPDIGQGDNEVCRWEYIVQVSGNRFPDKKAWEYMIKAVSTASVVGIPTTDRPGRSFEHMKLLEGFQTIFLSVLKKLGIPVESLLLADSAGHHMLHASGWFRRLLLPSRYPGLCQQFGLPAGFRPRVLVVGNLAGPFADLLHREGCLIAGIVQPVGMHNLENAIEQIYRQSFDLALVSAGTPAKYICSEVARQMGKVVLDTGQLFDELLKKYGHLDNTNYQIPIMSFM